MTATLWTPDRPKKRVRVCVGCGQEFPLTHESRFIRHAEACQDGAVEEHVALQNSNAFSGYADPEAMEWIGKRLAQGKPGAKRGRPT